MAFSLPKVWLDRHMSETTYTQQVAGNVRAELARAGYRSLAGLLDISAPTARTRWNGTSAYTLAELAELAAKLDIPVSVLTADPQP